MRLLIELKSIQDTIQELQYHVHVQGFFYDILRGSPFESLHDQQGSKFFSFSNLFPYNNFLGKNDIRTLIISSPNKRFIKYIFDILKIIASREYIIRIGYMKFKINFLKELYPKVNGNENGCSLITGTPISIRISQLDYKKYGYESVYDNFTYWKNGHPLGVFIEQLQNKLICKYAKYHTVGKTIHEYREFLERYRDIKIFDIFKFKKQISTRAIIGGYEQIIIATVWEFMFNKMSNKKRDLVQFALDSGLGERNSLGFGFMNKT